MGFAGQVAVITGASSGIGYEVAKQLARKKCHVGLLARRRDRLELLAQECRALGVHAEVVDADVTDRRRTVEAIHSLRDRLGPIDLLVANSGVGLPTCIEPMNMDDVDNMVRVNYLGVLYAIEAVLPEMLQRNKGHLSAVSSLASYTALPGESGYCSSKMAVNVYLQGLRVQLAPRNIAVTTICPGFITTPMTAPNEFHMPWLMSAEKAAEKMVWALEKRKKVYNFPRQTTLLCKFANWLPGFVLRWAMRSTTVKEPRVSKC